MSQTVDRPIAFIVAATRHGAMIINRHDYRTTDGNAYGVGLQLLNTSQFDQHEVNALRQLLDTRRSHFGDGVVLIDCGANIGVHTIDCARHMHGWGNVLAFEAQERIFYALAGNIAINNCFNARAIWAAVGDIEHYIDVPVPNYHVPSSFGSLELRYSPRTEYIGQDIDYGTTHSSKTRMLTIDSLRLDRVDFVKIDIEGMEMEALKGAITTLSTHRPQLLIEKIKSNESELIAFVESYGYATFPLGLNILAVHRTDPACSLITIT